MRQFTYSSTHADYEVNPLQISIDIVIHYTVALSSYFNVRPSILFDLRYLCLQGLVLMSMQCSDQTRAASALLELRLKR